MTDTTEAERFETWEVHGHDLWVRASDYDALAAERDAFASNIPDAAQNLIRNAHTGRLNALHRAKVAEAALPAVYRLALEAARRSATLAYDGDHSAAKAIQVLPTPTAAELMARIQTGEKK